MADFQYEFEGILYLLLHDVISKKANGCGIIGRKDAQFWLTQHLRFKGCTLFLDKILYDMVGLGLLEKVNMHTYKVLSVGRSQGLEEQMKRN